MLAPKNISSKRRGAIIDKNAKRYFDSAQDLFLPVKAIDLISGFELKLGKHLYYFSNAETPLNNACSAYLAETKHFTNELLNEAGIPVPKAVCLYKSDYQEELLAETLQDLKFPLVIKPVDGSRGTDVLCNIQTLKELQTLLNPYFTKHSQVLIEEFHSNLKSYRVLVLNQRIIGVVLRHPASVVGDGINSIKELIEPANIQRKKINKYVGPIQLDYETHIRLKELGIGADYIPAEGEKVVLCYTSNAARGGNYETIPKKICKENLQIIFDVVTTLNLKLAAIDIQCSDLRTPMKKTNGVIIEVGGRPNLRIHELPMKGAPQQVSRKIMRYFIYRHPIAYLHSLYFNKHTATYVRSSILAIIVLVVYKLISSGSI